MYDMDILLCMTWTFVIFPQYAYSSASFYTDAHPHMHLDLETVRPFSSNTLPVV